jgi:hypothetical protein
MTKKLILAALAAFTLVGLGTDAYAQGRIRTENVFFRTSALNTADGFVDSLVMQSVGAAGASSVLDTTAGISTARWLIPQNMQVGDSAVVATLYIYDSPDGDCESGADSLGVAVQVSPDGSTWTTLATVAGQTTTANMITSRNNQTIANSAFLDRLSDNGASLANGQPIWNFKFKARGNTGLATLDQSSIFHFPFVRFITSAHDAKGYKVRAKIVYNSNGTE